MRKFLNGFFGEQAFSGDPKDGLGSIFRLCIRVPQGKASLKSRVLTIHFSPIDALFERMTHGWWQRLGGNCLRVMEAAAEAKR